MLTNGIASSAPGRYAVVGPMEFANAAALLEQGSAAFSAAAPGAALSVDLLQVGRTDSAGLAVLMEWLATARHSGHNLTVINAPVTLLALARVSQLDTIILGAQP